MADTSADAAAAGAADAPPTAASHASAGRRGAAHVAVATSACWCSCRWCVVVQAHLRRTGWQRSVDAIDRPTRVHAFRLTAEIAVIAVVDQHGVRRRRRRCCSPATGSRARGCSSALHRPADLGVADRRRPRPGAGVRPVNGWFGPALADAGIQVIYALPGMVLATVFVSLPLVLREVVPSSRRRASTRSRPPGRSAPTRWQRFRRITLPTIRCGRSRYGIVLSLARSPR